MAKHIPYHQRALEPDTLLPAGPVVYLWHFDLPYVGVRHNPAGKEQTARHYLGSSVDLLRRAEEHLSGRGSPLIAAALAAGRDVRLVSVWPCETVEEARRLERQLKRWHHGAAMCRECQAEKRLAQLLGIMHTTEGNN